MHQVKKPFHTDRGSQFAYSKLPTQAFQVSNLQNQKKKLSCYLDGRLQFHPKPNEQMSNGSNGQTSRLRKKPSYAESWCPPDLKLCENTPCLSMSRIYMYSCAYICNILYIIHTYTVIHTDYITDCCIRYHASKVPSNIKEESKTKELRFKESAFKVVTWNLCRGG